MIVGGNGTLKSRVFIKYIFRQLPLFLKIAIIIQFIEYLNPMIEFIPFLGAKSQKCVPSESVTTSCMTPNGLELLRASAAFRFKLYAMAK
jgi:hypothetical protein